ALFEYCYLPEFPQVVRSLRDHYQGSMEAFWEDFRSRPGISKPSDAALINSYAMAACYSARDGGVPELPFDPVTGGIRPLVWERWLDWDPVRMVARRQQAARSLRAVYLDGGRHDEYFLEVGAGAFKAALEAVGVKGVHLELFDAGHGGIEYRYPV
ncbi:esterase, partial [mine drainage metagenome]